MPNCKNHSWKPAVYNGMCQDCLDQDKRDVARGKEDLPPSAVKWTPGTIKETFAAAAKKQKDQTKGYYRASGAKGMHVHVHPGGVHAKIGDTKHKFITQDGSFDGKAWNDAIADLKDRNQDQTTDGIHILAAMAITLAELKGGLQETTIDKLVAGLPIPPKKK